MPQECRSDARTTYRCYLRGPDGVRELAPYGSWGNTQNVVAPPERVKRGNDETKGIGPMPEPRELLLEDDASIRRLLADSHRIAVLGIRSERRADRPAHYVARYLADAGYDVIPVPVYEPDVTTILGRPVHRRLADVPPPIDLVIVFRRSEDIPPHLDDLLAARPAGVWFQSGIRNDVVARRLAEAGIRVVQDRCAKIEHRFIRPDDENGGGRP